MTKLPRSPAPLLLIPLALFALAFAVRVWHLDSVPPGWRDDELINALVISQKALDGDIALYYPDASGHEGLYHILNAAFLAVFGAGAMGIRLLSVILGALTVPLTYLLGRKLFDEWVGLTAAFALTFSFWSLMYSRIGLRHILMPVLVTAAFYFFWRGFRKGDPAGRPYDYGLTAVFTGLSFYTYFASRGLPLILLAFMGYVFLFDREKFKQEWRKWGMMLGLTAVIALPLFLTLNQQPESESRVAELAVPLVEARAGNFAPLHEHIITTLSMFHATGDGEWLYNIPNRPVFGTIGALFFWAGVLIALYYALNPLISRYSSLATCNLQLASASAFLLLWWLAGISPAFISVPPASLGHTIMAQTAVYLIAALPIWAIGRWVNNRWVSFAFAILLVGSIAARDLPDYFVEWPSRGMVRFLYRADIQEVAEYLNENEIADVSISSLLAGTWDQVAFEIGRDEAATTMRYFNPERAIFLNPSLAFTGYPDVENRYADWLADDGIPVGGYTLTFVDQVTRDVEMVETPICFENGLCWTAVSYEPDQNILELGWGVLPSYEKPPFTLISNPPPPGVYAGSRLWVFAQLQDADGNFLTGDDGFWVDAQSLQANDMFLQQHHLPLPADAAPAAIIFGLYDPMTGERILTESGAEFITIELE